jgi:hypothetical protein
MGHIQMFHSAGHSGAGFAVLVIVVVAIVFLMALNTHDKKGL